MRVVFRHPEPILAQAARDYLLTHGILSAVVSRTEGWMAAVRSYEVMLCFASQHEEARELLAGGEWREPGGGPEADEALPDLAALDPALAPRCPGCDATLPLDASLEQCPRCALVVDVAELIALEHGPEALENCYEAGEALLDPRALERLILLCPGCEYSLDGLPRASTCPECGRAYDKDRIIREFLAH